MHKNCKHIHKAKSAQTQSREKFTEEGEKNTQYFLNLEKANVTDKIMDRLQTDNGDLVTINITTGNHHQEQVTFFRIKKGFSRKGRLNETKAELFARNISTTQLSQHQKDDLESDIPKKKSATH